MPASSGTATKEYGGKGFLRRLTPAPAWGGGLDGFDLGILGVVLISVAAELQISPIRAGLIGASSLIGIFLGAPIGGFLSDRFGRRLLFLIDICLFVVLGIAQAFVTEGRQLFVIRLLLGIAIGAEYSIGSSMLPELVPSHGRGRRDKRSEEGGGWRRLFAPGLRIRTFFACTFYICVVTPYFAIFTFAPTVFRKPNLDETAGTIFATTLAFIGARSSAC